MEREVWILFIKNQCTCDESPECIIAFETEDLLYTWLSDYCLNNKLDEDDLDYEITLKGVFNNESWRNA